MICSSRMVPIFGIIQTMKILFVAGFGPIITNQKASESLYIDSLGLSFTREEGDYLHTQKINGVKHFALWPLSQAAESCFGRKEWPTDIPVPQSWIEFDVENIEEATSELKDKGYKLLVASRKEPWGQIVTRFISPEGMLIGVTYTPWMRKEK